MKKWRITIRDETGRKVQDKKTNSEKEVKDVFKGLAEKFGGFKKW